MTTLEIIEKYNLSIKKLPAKIVRRYSDRIPNYKLLEGDVIDREYFPASYNEEFHSRKAKNDLFHWYCWDEEKQLWYERLIKRIVDNELGGCWVCREGEDLEDHKSEEIWGFFSRTVEECVEKFYQDKLAKESVNPSN